MNSQHHLLHAKRYFGASVVSSIKHYHHHHHWHHHQKAPSLPPALTTTRCYSPSVSLSPSSKKKRKEKTFPPSLYRDRSSLSFCLYLSLSLFPALALFPEISTICTFTPSPSLPPRPFRCSCTILVSVARMQKACSFVPTLKQSPLRPSHPSCPLRRRHCRHRRHLRLGHPLLEHAVGASLAYHVVTTRVCIHTIRKL